MDWSNEPYVRLYTRETTDDVELSWDAISLWRALLTKFDRSGLMEARNGWTSIAKAVRCDPKMAEDAGAELIRDGRVRIVQGGIFAPNFVAAQTASKSDKVRQRESRDRRRATAESWNANVDSNSNQGVTAEVSQPVTTAHEQSQNVTLCLASAEPLLCSALPSVIGEQAAPVSQPEAALKKRGTQIAADWQPRPDERTRAKSAGLDVDHEVEAFRDHHRARGNAYRDWDAAFRTWIRNGVKFRKPNTNRAGGVSQGLLDMANGDA